jgi:4-diphosphocytidyl-2-C-methyl-D-erythritol kinase
MRDQIVSLIAPAKLTLSLRVTGIRPDGFHLIDAEMVTLELADELTVDTSRTGLAITGKFADDLEN